MTISTSDIQALYIAYFNRPADALGLTFWTNAATQAGGVAVVANAFSASPEYAALYSGKSATYIVDSIYMNLFGRHAEPAGLTFWGNALESGQLNVGNIAYQIFQGAQDTVGGFQDKTAVSSKVSAANAFNLAMNNDAAAIRGYDGPAADAIVKTWLSGVVDAPSLAAAVTPSSLNTVFTNAEAANQAANATNFTLGVGVDTFLGGNGSNVFNATLDNTVTSGVVGVITPLATATFGGADTITGAGSSNTLSLTDSSGTSVDTMPIGATITNIQTIKLATAGNAGTLAVASATSPGPTVFDVSNVAGLKTLTITSNGVTGDNIKAAATTNVSEVSNGAGNDVSVSGGQKVTISASGVIASDSAAGSLTITDSGAGKAVNVTNAAADVTVAAKGDITADGTSLTASMTGAATYAMQQAHIAASNAAAAAAGAADAASLHATAVAAGLSITLHGAIVAASTVEAVNAATLTAETSGYITQAQRAAIDAAFSTALTATGGTVASARIAALAVEAPIQTTATTAATQAGNAATVADAAAVTAAGVVTADGVAAIAGHAISDILSTVLTSVSATGNYLGIVAVTDASTLNNTLTTVTLNNAGTAALSGNALTQLNLSNQVNAVVITNQTVGHTDTLTLNTVNAVVSDSAAVTVNIVSNGTAGNAVQLADIAATAVNLTGTAGVDLTGSGLAATAVITGNGSDTVILSGATQSFMGGTSGSNTITTGAVVQTVTVDGGTGGNNTLVLANNLAFSTTASAAKFIDFSNIEVLNGVTADVTKFTGSTVTGVTFNGGTSTLTGLSAAQADNITVVADGIYTVGVTGALTVGQLDTVHLTVDAGGSPVALTSLSLAGVETLHLTAVDTVTIDSLLTAAALTNVNIDGAGDVSITTGLLALNVNTVFDAHTATGAVFIDASSSSANGLKIIGSTTGANTLLGNALASVLVGGNGGDTITGGAGNDSITSGNGHNTIVGGGGNDTITVGNGINSISAVSGTIVAGNGDNSIVLTGLVAGASSITVGTGANLIDVHGADVAGHSTAITLGAHTAATGVDTILVGSFAAVAGAAPLVVITGAVAGDLITFADTPTSVVQVTGTQQTSISAAASLAAAIAIVDAAAITVAGHQATVFQYGTNTYVLESVATGTGTLAIGDSIVELVGTHTLSSHIATHVVVGS
ncbi:S-layer family protein [Rugamonas sp.]|uniref:beta strand repeat-containing protein n=1 Tax=Rugamonas sp. TaxID=1926287 RepID=UPI0025EDB612|nr:DUF4214 domain-containing protein [Rugamonas sp.]